MEIDTLNEEGMKYTTRLKVPGTIQQIPRLARYQISEYLHSKRFIALVAIVVAIGAIFSFIMNYYRSTAITDAVSFYSSSWAGGVTFIIVLSAVFFGGDSIAGEFQNKTGYFLMSAPIRRSTVYVGKFIAAFLSSFVIVLIFLLIMIANGAYYFGENAFPWQLGASLLFSLAYLLAVLGTTFFFSSLFKTSSYGFVLTAILFLIGFSLLQTVVTGFAKTEPWMVISYAQGVIGQVFNSPINWGLSATVSTTKFRTPSGIGTLTTYSPGIAEGILIMLCYFVLTSIAGLFLFEREEFT